MKRQISFILWLLCFAQMGFTQSKNKQIVTLANRIDSLEQVLSIIDSLEEVINRNNKDLFIKDKAINKQEIVVLNYKIELLQKEKDIEYSRSRTDSCMNEITDWRMRYSKIEEKQKLSNSEISAQILIVDSLYKEIELIRNKQVFAHASIVDLQKKEIGGLSFYSSESDLKRYFGENNVESGEGESVEGYIFTSQVMSGTINEFGVEWTDSSRTKIRIIWIYGKGSNWQTTEGVSISTTLMELNRLNQRPFTYSGFEWDYGGTILSWNGGHFPDWFKPLLTTKNSIFYDSHIGDIEFSSNTHDSLNGGLFVDKIRIHIDD